MKKHEIIVKTENGTLLETYIISPKSARTLKAEGNVKGLIAITESSRVQHPSPAVMCAALEILGVDLTSFYTKCELLREHPEIAYAEAGIDASEIDVDEKDENDE